jgi:DNA-binding LacI/PurR family transcriptional regulator
MENMAFFALAACAYYQKSYTGRNATAAVSGRLTHEVPVQRRVTVNQIAAKVGLSQPAVSMVLNGSGRISDSTRRRVLKVAEQMGYRPNAAARAIITKKTRQVGVLVMNDRQNLITSPYTYYTILGLNIALEEAGYVLCLIRIGDVAQAIEGHSRVFREHVLDGVIVTTAIPEHLCAAVERLVPVTVWADADVWRPTCCIRRDEPESGRLCGEAVVRGGYKRVIYITEAEQREEGVGHFSFAAREQGLRSVLEPAGVEVSVIRKRWGWREGFADELAPRLTPDTAVVASDVPRLRLVAQVAAAHRLISGVDFGLACCDDIPEFTYGWPHLSRAIFDRVELGRQAAQMMLELLDNPGAQPPSQVLPSGWIAGTTLRATPPT